MESGLLLKAESLIAKLNLAGLSIELSGPNSLRVKGDATKKQIETIRQFKAQIIEALSPNCLNCGLALTIIEDENFWFCPLGCGSRSNHQNVTVAPIDKQPSHNHHTTVTQVSNNNNNALNRDCDGCDGCDGCFQTKSNNVKKGG